MQKFIPENVFLIECKNREDKNYLIANYTENEKQNIGKMHPTFWLAISNKWKAFYFPIVLLMQNYE